MRRFGTRRTRSSRAPTTKRASRRTSGGCGCAGPPGSSPSARRRRAPAASPVGVVSLGEGKDEEGRVAEIFGLWVAPAARGTGVATKLVEASADRARRDGRTHVSYWVGTDNGRAVAFASGIGFRPTDFRRPMRVASTNGAEPDDDLPEEIAMVLPLGEDRGRPDVL